MNHSRLTYEQRKLFRCLTLGMIRVDFPVGVVEDVDNMRHL